MSYDVHMCDSSGELLAVDRFEDGGTYCVGGTSDASLNITYNYARLFRLALDREQGIRWLYGKTGAETIGRLRAAVEALGTRRDDDYWKPTDGNAGAALARLLSWAEQHPDGIFDGD